MPKGSGLRRPKLIVHETSQWDLRAEVRRHGIPCTGIARTSLDLAAVVGPNKLRQGIDDALRRKLVDLAALAEVLSRHARRGRNGVRRFRLVIEQYFAAADIPRSYWSRLVADLLVEAGLPRPELEFVVDLGGGWIVYLDLAYPLWMLGLELDSGSWHLNRRAHEEDPRRRNRLENAGWSIRNFTWTDYAERPHEIVDVTRKAFCLLGATF